MVGQEVQGPSFFIKVTCTHCPSNEQVDSEHQGYLGHPGTRHGVSFR